MGPAKSGIAAVCAGLAVVAIAGCGSSGSLLSSDQATQLKHQLTQAQTALDAKRCAAARAAISNFTNTVNALSGVNGTVTMALNDGAQRVSTLLVKDCVTVKKKPPTHTTTTATHTTATKTTSTTSTQTTSTQTTPGTTATQTTPGTTVPQTTTQPNSGGSGPGTSTTGGAGL